MDLTHSLRDEEDKEVINVNVMPSTGTIKKLNRTKKSTIC
jgi:hypothetical protein